MKKVKLLLIFLFCIFFKCFSQNGFASYLNSIAASNTRTAVTTDPSGNMWYSSSTRGIYKFDGANWSVFDTTNSGIVSNVAYTIKFDLSGNAWIGTNKGISKFNGTNWITYNHFNSGLPSDSVYCFFFESTNVWIGTKRGLAKFDGSLWSTYTVFNSGLIDNYVTTLNMNTDGDLWIGTNKGLSVKTFNGWTTYNSTNSYMADSYVSDIYFESSSKAWIAMKDQGLFKFENNVFSFMNPILKEYGLWPLNNLRSVSRGPQGGALFSGVNNNVYGLVELLGSQSFFYPFPTSTYVCDLHTYDSSANKLWFLKLTGFSSYNYLFSFDYSVASGQLVSPVVSNLAYLDVNEVKAAILNRGDMHWNTIDASYEVPKGSGRNAIFNSNLWIGGLDAGNNLHQAAMTYRQSGNDYWPGPLDTITGTTDASTSAAYDKIWKLDKWQIDEFRTMFANGSVAAGTYTPAYNIINWPAHGGGAYTRNMAPFVDVNGDGIYNPLADGDYPKIKGDQMCYWIFNDNLSTHTESHATPLKVEVHASAYAYSCQNIEDSMKVVNYTTFYSFDVYNRSTSNYHDVYLGIYSHHSLGSYADDYTGSNPAGNYSFEYNGDPYDECLTHHLGYGNRTPVLSKVFLDGPLALATDSIDNNNNGIIDEPGEKNLMTNYLCWVDGGNPSSNNSPNYPAEFYNLMHSVWNDGTHLTTGGYGYGGTDSTNFLWSGVPGDPSGWSQTSLNYPFIDYRMVTSCGPFSFNSGQKVNVDFAYVFTRDDTAAYNINNLYYKNWNDVKRIQRWYAADSFPSCDPPLATNTLKPQKFETEFKVYPNPSTDYIAIEFRSKVNAFDIEIYNIQGQLKRKISCKDQMKSKINIQDLSPGLYLIRLTSGSNASVQRFVKQ